MNRLVLSVAVVMFMSTMFVPVLFSEGVAADDPEPEDAGPVDMTITGKIYATPLPDSFDVRILVDGALTAVADADGGFGMTITGTPDEECDIVFEMAGYAVLAYIYNGVRYEENALTITFPDADADATLFVIMEEREAYITGRVVWSNGAAVGGGVTVIAESHLTGAVYIATTGSGGMFSIKCPVGMSYTVSVVHQVYEAEPREVVGLNANVNVGDFVLLPKAGATYLFGFDLTHSLMVIGGIAGLFMLIFVVLYRIHIGRHPERSKVYSDPGKKDQN